MFERQYSRLRSAGCLLVLALGAVPSAAEELATVSTSAVDVAWAPLEARAAMTLTVSGPDVALRLEVEGGESALLSLFDAAGEPLPDGEYNWELTALPGVVPGEWRDPANGRDAGRPLVERPETAPAASQGGWFAIVDGRLVAPGAAARWAFRGDADASPSLDGQPFDQGGLHDE